MGWMDSRKRLLDARRTSVEEGRMFVYNRVEWSCGIALTTLTGDSTSSGVISYMRSGLMRGRRWIIIDVGRINQLCFWTLTWISLNLDVVWYGVDRGKDVRE